MQLMEVRHRHMYLRFHGEIDERLDGRRTGIKATQRNSTQEPLSRVEQTYLPLISSNSTKSPSMPSLYHDKKRMR